MTITYLQHKISCHKRLRMRQPWRFASIKYEGGKAILMGGGGQGAQGVGEGGWEVGANAGLVS